MLKVKYICTFESTWMNNSSHNKTNGESSGGMYSYIWKLQGTDKQPHVKPMNILINYILSLEPKHAKEKHVDRFKLI